MVQLVMHRCDAPVTILTFMNNLSIGQTSLIHMKYCVLSYPKNKTSVYVCVRNNPNQFTVVKNTDDELREKRELWYQSMLWV